MCVITFPVAGWGSPGNPLVRKYCHAALTVQRGQPVDEQRHDGVTVDPCRAFTALSRLGPQHIHCESEAFDDVGQIAGILNGDRMQSHSAAFLRFFLCPQRKVNEGAKAYPLLGVGVIDGQKNGRLCLVAVTPLADMFSHRFKNSLLSCRSVLARAVRLGRICAGAEGLRPVFPDTEAVEQCDGAVTENAMIAQHASLKECIVGVLAVRSCVVTATRLHRPACSSRGRETPSP